MADLQREGFQMPMLAQRMLRLVAWSTVIALAVDPYGTV